MYKKGIDIASRFFSPRQVFKFGFNISPMYRRTTGRITYVSKNLHIVNVEIPLNYKNRNYSGTIFGGSLFSATDPIYLTQLSLILGDKFIVWDKQSEIDYIKPAISKAFIVFEFTEEEINEIKLQIKESRKTIIVKNFSIISKNKVVFAKLKKTIFISTKEYYDRLVKRKNKKVRN